MKTCRFCNNQQENGDRCDACGSPFSADKVDFSEGFPDLAGGESAFPDPTASSFPDPAIPQIPEPTVPVAPVPVDATLAEETPAAKKHLHRRMSVRTCIPQRPAERLFI